MSEKVVRRVNLIGPGPDRAYLKTESEGAIWYDHLSNKRNILRVPAQLPVILAGPIVRRVDAKSAVIWIATSVDVRLEGELTHKIGDRDELIAKASSVATQLGEKLFIHLATFVGDLPKGKPLEYNFDVILKDDLPGIVGFTGDKNGHLLSSAAVSYGKSDLPSFFIPAESDGQVRILHASCRKLHGHGIDAAGRLDEMLAEHYEDVKQRPSALFLTGDQIYADDVHEEVSKRAIYLGRTLLGWDEYLPGDGNRVATHEAGKRAEVAKQAEFTSGQAESHLLGFGEYAGMYLLAWSPDVWKCTRYRSDFLSADTTSMRFGADELRRVLANVPTYMIFDDHDVTDDWNINSYRYNKVFSSPAGKRIVANALAAYWVFQGLGNDPAGNVDAIRPKIEEYFDGRGANAAAFEHAMWGFRAWDYSVATGMPAAVLDTRASRDLGAIQGDVWKLGQQFSPSAHRTPPPALLNGVALIRLKNRLSSLPGGSDDPLIIVSAAPFVGYFWHEQFQLIGSASKLRPPLSAIDPEAWSFNSKGVAGFLRILAASGRTRFVILSGDVHYGFTAVCRCSVRDTETREWRVLKIVQATSSGLKNENQGSIGWVLNRSDGFERWVGSLVGGDYLLGKRDSRSLAGDEGYDIDVKWRYMEMERRAVVTENNAGLVRVNKTSVLHTLRTAEGSFCAEVFWDAIEAWDTDEPNSVLLRRSV